MRGEAAAAGWCSGALSRGPFHSVPPFVEVWEMRLICVLYMCKRVPSHPSRGCRRGAHDVIAAGTSALWG